ncbi:zincin-like metallopeptidase toxin domain-containing protein [Myroides sp. NP-2]|uniref:zincin-like metallopeptidase toxin domain-containing protein n=1 Tax=Myroides sp. NP-2 TaxID=2759945 RepID=UPI0015F97CDC|nr:zincin-like metallopeptidase toxin domain-containing protein [Myroides sp. NP-2]
MEAIDDFREAWEAFSFADFYKIPFQLHQDMLVELLVFLDTSDRRENYNFDRIAYTGGFGFGFIASLFIPLANVSKVSAIAKFSKFIPEEFVSSLNIAKVRSLKESKALVKWLEEVAVLLSKKGDELYQELRALLNKVIEWMKTNSKRFERNSTEIPNLTKSDLDWMATRRVGNLGGNVLKASQIRKLRGILNKKGIQLIVEGDSKSITKLFKPIDNFKIYDNFIRYMYSFNPPKVGGFHAPTKQFFLIKNSTELIAFHEMSHVKHFEEVGEVAYKNLKDLDKEMYVWKQILNNRSKWTKAELNDALTSINRLRVKKYDLEPIKIK